MDIYKIYAQIVLGRDDWHGVIFCFFYKWLHFAICFVDYCLWFERQSQNTNRLPNTILYLTLIIIKGPSLVQINALSTV